MNFIQIITTKRTLVCIALAALVCVALTFFPLIGALGFEYAVITAFVLSFISVFIAGEFAGPNLKQTVFSKRTSDNISSVFLINFVILTLAFLIGLLSSLIKGDCYVYEGVIFFILIPAVSVFFSTSLGLLCGYLFKRRGFFIGALLLIAIILYSLYKLYGGLSLFVYNPVYGLFPGPLYDEVIPITNTLIAYRAITLLWGALLLLAVKIIASLRHKHTGVWDIVLPVLVIAVLAVSYSNKEEIGFDYSRSYITENVLPGKVETDNFIIYYDPGSPEAKYIDLIAEDHQWRFDQLKEILQVEPDRKIRSYIYPGTDSRKKYTGAGETTIANPIHMEIHMVYEGFPHPILKHELTHVMASEFGTKYLKISPHIGLLEGIAVAADWNGSGYTRHQWSKALIENNMAPEIEDIVGYGFWYAPPQVSYTLMGSFSKYLIDQYGMEKFKGLYGSGDFSVYGKTLGELTAEWKEFLNGVELPEDASAITRSRFDAPAIFEAVCPRRVAALKKDGYESYRDDNFHRAARKFTEALEYDRSNASLITGLLYSQYFSGDYETVIESIDQTKSLREVDANVLRNLRGNALWQTDRNKEALEIYKTLSEEPLPEDIKREIDIKIAALSAGGKVAENIKEFFATRDRAHQAVLLGKVIDEHSGFAPANYLLGRLYYNKDKYEAALPYFMQANESGLPTDKLALENLRLLAISLYAAGDYMQAADVSETLSVSGEDSGMLDYALDFGLRALWAEENRLNK